MNQYEFSKLLLNIVEDFERTTFIWQLGSVLASIGFGKWLASRLCAFFQAHHHGHGKQEIRSALSFVRVLSPVMIYLFLYMSRKILEANSLPIHFFRIIDPLVLALISVRTMHYLVGGTFARKGQMMRRIARLNLSLTVIIWVVAVLHITDLLPFLRRFLEAVVIPIGSSSVSLARILQACMSVVITLLIALWLSAELEARLMKFSGITTSSRLVLARACTAILILVAVLVSLSLVGIKLTILSVFGGALGVGLGLGLQRVASNYVSGFIILLDRGINIGDMVQVDKYAGTVTRINTRYSVLLGHDGVESVVPNEMLVFNPIRNLSLSSRLTRLSTTVGVDYNCDVPTVLKLLEAAAAKVERVEKEPAPHANLTDFGESALQFELRFWISDPDNGRANVKSRVNVAIWEALKANQINIPFPQRDIHWIKGVPPMVCPPSHSS